MYRFLASTRWVGWLLMVMVFAAVCGLLSWWQWDRRAEVAADNQNVSANWDSSAVDVDTARPWLQDLPHEREYTPVEMTGRYLSDATLLVRQRTVSSSLGMEVLVPFEVEDGTVVLVDRGWLPNGDAADQRPNDVPAPPSGTVSVTARLVPGEPDIGRDAPKGQIASIHLPQVASTTGARVQQGAYALLSHEDPAPAAAPKRLPKPEGDEGMHWSYALQWAGFAVLFFVAFGYAARQQARLNREDKEALERGEEPRMRARKVPRAKALKPRRDGSLHDEDVEDALLEATPLAEFSGEELDPEAWAKAQRDRAGR
ncbi:MAG: SURF1 family cytochrome oxidase biogenesis protein [Galactobacter sp.]